MRMTMTTKRMRMKTSRKKNLRAKKTERSELSVILFNFVWTVSGGANRPWKVLRV